METQKDRVLLLLKEMHYGQARFEDEIGASHGCIAHMSDYISANMVRKITTRFPHVNSAWLLTGKGDMMVSEKTERVSPERRQLLDEIAEQHALIDKLVAQVDKINNTIAACQNTINELTKRL